MEFSMIPFEVTVRAKEHYNRFGKVILGQTKINADGNVAKDGKDALSIMFIKVNPGVNFDKLKQDKGFEGYPIKVVFMGQMEARPAYPN